MATKMFFSVYDTVAQVYSVPFCALTKAAAVRTFADACVDKSLALSAHPVDYDLRFIGYFDDDTGMIGSPSSEDELILVSGGTFAAEV